MTNFDVVLRIENMFDAQMDEAQMYNALTALESELLGDASGRRLKALRAERTADFWKRDKRPEAPQMEAYFRSQAKQIMEAV